MMIGLPRSGKSTWVGNHKKSTEVIISADKIRYLVYNQQFWAEGEPLMWSIRDIMLKCLMEQGIDIIIDETNTTKKRRLPIIKLAKKYNYFITGHIVDTSSDVCKTRAIEANMEKLIPIIERMGRQFEIPDESEGFDYIGSV